MRALLGGIVGAVVSAAAWLGIEHVQQTNYGWMVILVGIVTGMFVNKSGAGTTTGFARGALAMILTLAGIVGGQKGYALFMEKTTTARAAAAVEVVDLGGEEEASDEEEETGEVEAAPAPLPVLDAAPVGGVSNRSYSKSAMKKNLSGLGYDLDVRRGARRVRHRQRWGQARRRRRRRSRGRRRICTASRRVFWRVVGRRGGIRLAPDSEPPAA